MICLYRVSSDKQIEGGDIPLQKKACRVFCLQRKWTIVDEIMELGVSGYKNNVTDRQGIQEIMKRAKRNEFDIILAYLPDRFGRREYQTGVFLESLIRQGIQVWTTEGQIRMDTARDRQATSALLSNAQTEVETLSMRIRTKQAQMAMNGEYRGGKLGLGYITVESPTKKNRLGVPVKLIQIEETKAEVVRFIFEKRLSGMSSYAIATELNKESAHWDPPRFFRESSIDSILRNRSYLGQMKYGRQISLPLEHLRIVSNELFNGVSALQKKQSRPRPVKAQELPVRPAYYDQIYCGACGHRLIYCYTAKRSDSGVIYPREIYRCYGRFEARCPCTGQVTYGKDKVDQRIMDKVYEVLAILAQASRKSLIENAVELAIAEFHEKSDEHRRTIEHLEEEIEFLHKQMIDAAKQYGVKSTTQMHYIINDLTLRRNAVSGQLKGMRLNQKDRERLRQDFGEVLEEFTLMYKNFGTYTDDELQAAAAELFERIEVTRGYAMKYQPSPQIKMFLPLINDMVELEDPKDDDENVT